MEQNTIMSSGPLEEAMKQFEEVQEEYNQLVAENAEFFARLYDITQRLNDKNNRVRNLLREAEYNIIGPFRKSVSAKETIDVDLLQDLAPDSINLPELYQTTTKVNKAVLAGYVAEGRISQEAIDQATITGNPSIRIYGPKQIHVE